MKSIRLLLLYRPDIGAVLHGEKAWSVGVDGRVPLWGT